MSNRIIALLLLFLSVLTSARAEAPTRAIGLRLYIPSAAWTVVWPVVLLFAALCCGAPPTTQQSPRLAVNLYVPQGQWTIDVPCPMIIELRNIGPEEISLSYEQHEWRGTAADVPKRGFFAYRVAPSPQYAEVMVWYRDLPIVWPNPKPKNIVQSGPAKEPRNVVIPAGKEYLFKVWLSADALEKGENQIQCTVAIVGEPVVCSEAVRIYCVEPEQADTRPATK